MNSAVHSLQKLLVQWQPNLTKCESIELDLEEMEVVEMIGGELIAQGKVYASLREFVECTLNRFNVRTTTAQTRTKDLDFAREDHSCTNKD